MKTCRGGNNARGARSKVPPRNDCCNRAGIIHTIENGADIQYFIACLSLLNFTNSVSGITYTTAKKCTIRAFDVISQPATTHYRKNVACFQT